MEPLDSSKRTTRLISTPDQRLRVFVSSTLAELNAEREAAGAAITSLRLTPVTAGTAERLEASAESYRYHVEQSDVFVGIYWQSFGRMAPDSAESDLADEYTRSAGMPRLIYVREPSPDRSEGLTDLLTRIRADGTVTYRDFETTEELADLLVDDLAFLVNERFHLQVEGPGQGTSTLTFMFTDLEDSTGMLRQLGDDYRDLLATYHRLVIVATSRHRGHPVSTEGDGLFCVFATPADSLGAAGDIQAGIGVATWPGGLTPRCRIGIHTGTATRTMEGYVGLDVHVAARIGAAAQGGQILISTATSDHIADVASRNRWSIVDLGHYDLRGIGRSERLMRVDMPGLPVISNAPRARPRTPSVVPAAARPIIGRVDDVRGATEMLLRESVRLVTVTGPGGTGKTRLAIEMASRLEADFQDGIVFVELAAVRDPDRFLAVVARALGVQESGERTLLDGLQSVMADARLLLVLDNMEQLLAAAPDVGRLLETLPNVRILVTSRSPLRISWEHEYPLLPLPVPGESADAGEIEASDSVTLFVERARAVRPDFGLTPRNEPIVAEITRRLDGLPLAIELAAARLRSFTPEVLLARLDDRLGLLHRGSPDVPERHRTLRAAIGWSHDLLDDAEKTIFRRLAVFAGGWTLDATLAVCSDENLGEAQIMDVLEELVAKSLVVFSIDEHGESRYRLLETLREFSFEQLRAAGEETEVRSRHLRWCRSLAEHVMTVLPTPEFPPFLDAIERDRFNLREALAWSVSTGLGTDDALLTCGMLPLFFDTRGYVAEGLRWTRALVAATTAEGDTFPRAVAHAALGWLEMLAGDPDESEWALSTAVEMCRRLDNDEWVGRSLAMQGMTTYNRGLYDEAEAQFLEAVEICDRNGLEWLSDGWCAYGLAHVALARNDFVKAEALLNEAFEFSDAHGLTWGVGHTQLSLGVLAFMMGQLELSIDRLTRSLLVRQQLRDSRGICDCIGMMALHASVRGEHELAAMLIGAAEVGREASGDLPVPWLQPLIEEATISATAALGEEYGKHCAAGRDLSIDQAVELILARFSPSGIDAEAVVVRA